MEANPIITKPGRIDDCIHLVDVFQYFMKRVCTAFIVETPDAAAIIDTGVSDDVIKILRYMKKHDIPRRKVQFLVPSHFHFDHFGGGWKLWQAIKEENPRVKVATTERTKAQLQDATAHIQRASRTFGADFVGEMKPLPDEAYTIIDPGDTIPLDGLETNQKLTIIDTPGHTPDHVCPTLLDAPKHARFMFLGEAAGALFHSTKLATFGTSMPPDFNFNDYVASLKKIMEYKPDLVGYCHFGAVKGQEHAWNVMQDNLDFTFHFRDFVKENFEKHGSIRPVVEKFIAEEAPARIDWAQTQLLTQILVALIYGQLVDLGLKQPK